MRFAFRDDDATVVEAGIVARVSFLVSQSQRRFEQNVKKYQNRVFGFAMYFLGDRAEAEDVSQEVLLRLWHHHEDLEDDRLLGWLLRVTRNACVDALRKRKSRLNVMTPTSDDFGHAAAKEPTPDADAEASDFQVHLRSALDKVAEPYRSIVILREIQELKYEEISGAMNLPLNTVKVYLHRGRKMLREHLSEVLHRETA